MLRTLAADKLTAVDSGWGGGRSGRQGRKGRRELAEGKEAEADGELCAISSDWHMLEACGSSSLESGSTAGWGGRESAQGCHSVNSGINEVSGRRQVRWR